MALHIIKCSLPSAAMLASILHHGANARCYAAATIGDDIASQALLSQGSLSATGSALDPPHLLPHTLLSHGSPSASGGNPSPLYDSNDDGPDNNSYISDDGQDGGGVHSYDGFGAHGQTDDSAYSGDELGAYGDDGIG
jgi:hypothetical protein